MYERIIERLNSDTLGRLELICIANIPQVDKVEKLEQDEEYEYLRMHFKENKPVDFRLKV